MSEDTKISDLIKLVKIKRFPRNQYIKFKKLKLKLFS